MAGELTICVVAGAAADGPAVDEAFRRAGIPLADCYRETTDDGVLVLAPQTVDSGRFAGALPHALVATLRAHDTAGPLRVALHTGGFGPEHVSSPGITHAYGLLHTITPSRAAVVVVASERFHDEVVAHGPEVYERDGGAWVWRPAGPVVPASPEFWSLVGALADVPCLRDEHTRGVVVAHLPFADSVPYFSNRRTHVAAILRTCLDFEDGPARLLAALAAQDGPDAAPVRWVAALLAISGVRGYGP